MKKILILLLLIPVLAFGKEECAGVVEDDWYRVIKAFSVPSFWSTYHLHPGESVYVYGFQGAGLGKGFPKMAVFNSNGRYLDYYWMAGDNLDPSWLIYRHVLMFKNPEYCTFLENRKDNRYK